MYSIHNRDDLEKLKKLQETKSKMREPENNFMRKEWQNKNFINSTFRQLLLTLSRKSEK